MTSQKGQHVMISYQWDVQDRMLLLKDKLQRAGYRVWMDVDKMEGSILQSMGEAVENAAVVLMCISSKYQNSISCRTEAEYAFKKNRSIIPLMAENHDPTGWLGVLLGSRLYYRVDTDDQLNQNFPALIRALGDKGRILGQQNGNSEAFTGSVRDMARHYNGKSSNQQNIFSRSGKQRIHGNSNDGGPMKTSCKSLKIYITKNTNFS
ncbi:uncharacterized protein [Amphiura filiformis]|uniref:uncharacterized protein n=1 Tax=Amphiura filiformis TaxID=82378 RepID=UPI003B225F1C